MILNAIVLLVIILLTLYLSTQGLLSAILSLITATFASILAMALFEYGPLEMLCGNYRPEFARGVTFLILFFLAFSGIRIGADYAVPKNIVLPTWIDRISGGVVGFFAAMMVVGTAVIGMEMLPLPTNILMYDRFPAKAEGSVAPNRDRLQLLRDDGGKVVEVPGIVAPQSSIWLAPDRFVLGIWDFTSGRSLGGAIPFAARHPDLSVESYGYRNVVQTGAAHALLPDLVHVTAAYRDKDAADIKRFNLAESGSQALVIHTEIDQGTDQPHVSADSDGFFRITPTEIRLVTDKGHQYYPVGYLDHGTTFLPTNLASGQLVDDYVMAPKDDPKASLKVIHDWVFPINEDENPTMLEIKQLARVEVADSTVLANVNTAAHFVPVAGNYPPHTDRQNPAELTLTVEIVNADKTRSPLAKADVYVLSATVQKREINGKFSTAYDKLLTIKSQWEKSESGWGDQIAGKAGVPEKYQIQSWIDRGLNEIKPLAAGDPVQWSVLVPVLLNGELSPDGRRNIEAPNRHFDESIVPLFKSATGALIKTGATDAQGKFQMTLPKGAHTCVVRSKSADLLVVWCRDVSAAPKTKIDAKCDTTAVEFKVDMRIVK